MYVPLKWCPVLSFLNCTAIAVQGGLRQKVSAYLCICIRCLRVWVFYFVRVYVGLITIEWRWWSVTVLSVTTLGKMAVWGILGVIHCNIWTQVFIDCACEQCYSRACVFLSYVNSRCCTCMLIIHSSWDAGCLVLEHVMIVVFSKRIAASGYKEYHILVDIYALLYIHSQVFLCRGRDTFFNFILRLIWYWGKCML